MNSLFVAAVEFGDACREYPIVFVGAGNENDKPLVAPVTVFGLGADENLYFEGGQWRASYLPALMRMYPFCLARVGDDQYAVCADASWGGLQDGQGQALFDGEGKPSPLLEQVQKGLEQFEREAHRTKLVGAKLLEHDLLRDMRFDAKLADGARARPGSATMPRPSISASQPLSARQRRRRPPSRPRRWPPPGCRRPRGCSGDAVPVGRRAVAVELGAGVHHQFAAPAAAMARALASMRTGIAVAQPHLGRHRHGLRHRAAHGAHDAAHQFRLVQQHRAAAVAVDHRAGQPKFRSTPAGPKAGQHAALSARQAGSLPSSCGRTGMPAGVRPPLVAARARCA
jgi:hypothetical protein